MQHRKSAGAAAGPPLRHNRHSFAFETEQSRQGWGEAQVLQPRRNQTNTDTLFIDNVWQVYGCGRRAGRVWVGAGPGGAGPARSRESSLLGSDGQDRQRWQLSLSNIDLHREKLFNVFR